MLTSEGVADAIATAIVTVMIFGSAYVYVTVRIKRIATTRAGIENRINRIRQWLEAELD